MSLSKIKAGSITDGVDCIWCIVTWPLMKTSGGLTKQETAILIIEGEACTPRQVMHAANIKTFCNFSLPMHDSIVNF
jgi:hypothetical protein